MRYAPAPISHPVGTLRKDSCRVSCLPEYLEFVFIDLFTCSSSKTKGHTWGNYIF